MTVSFTGTVGNYLMESSTTTVNTVSNTYVSLKDYDFDVTDVADGSVLQMSANMRFEEPLTNGTSIKIEFDGATTDDIEIPIDAAYNGTSLPLTLDVEFLISDSSGIKLIGRVTRISSKNGLVYYDYEQLTVSLNATLTDNTITLYAKNGDSKANIYVDNFRINHLRTI
jgi:hypothetical protein